MRVDRRLKDNPRKFVQAKRHEREIDGDLPLTMANAVRTSAVAHHASKMGKRGRCEPSSTDFHFNMNIKLILIATISMIVGESRKIYLNQ